MKKLLIRLGLCLLPLGTAGLSHAATQTYIPSTSTYQGNSSVINIASGTIRNLTASTSVNTSTLTASDVSISSGSATLINLTATGATITTATVTGLTVTQSTFTRQIVGISTTTNGTINNANFGAVFSTGTWTYSAGTINGTKTDNSTTTYTGPSRFTNGMGVTSGAGNAADAFFVGSSSISMTRSLIDTSSVTFSSATFGITFGANSDQKTFGYIDGTQFTGVGVSSQCIFNRAGGMLASNNTVNGSTVTLNPSSAKMFFMQTANGDGALVITNFLSATVTVTGANGTIISGTVPASNQVAISKAANSHAINLRFGTAAASTFVAWQICYLGTNTE